MNPLTTGRVHLCDGTLTLTQISVIYNVSIDRLVRLNDPITSPYRSETLKISEYRNRKIPESYVIYLPSVEDEVPLEEFRYAYTTHSPRIDDLSNYDYVYNIDNPHIDNNNYRYAYADKLNYTDSLTHYEFEGNRYFKDIGVVSGKVGPSKEEFTKFNCICAIYYSRSTKVSTWTLPTYPLEVEDSNSADFGSVTAWGRSVPYVIYNTSSRSLGFTLNLRDELCHDDLTYIPRLVAAIESACYPEYGSTGVVHPPEIYFRLGKHFSVKGILKRCSTSWKAPIIDGRLVNCDLSIEVEETSGPWSMSEVAGFKGYRDDWSV